MELWQESASKYREFDICFEILNAVVRFKESSYDKRALMSLPRKVRIVTPLFLKSQKLIRAWITLRNLRLHCAIVN